MAIKIHTPWTKIALSGRKNLFRYHIYGVSEFVWSLRSGRAISLFSILVLIANYEVVTSLNSRSQMSFADVQS